MLQMSEQIGSDLSLTHSIGGHGRRSGQAKIFEIQSIDSKPALARIINHALSPSRSRLRRISKANFNEASSWSSYYRCWQQVFRKPSQKRVLRGSWYFVHEQNEKISLQQSSPYYPTTLSFLHRAYLHRTKCYPSLLIVS